MLQEVVESAGLEGFAEIGLVVFLVAFLLVVVWVLLMNREEAEERAQMPLDEEDAENPPP